MTRFSNEDPRERLRILKKLTSRMQLQMPLRGQNVVGCRNCCDSVVTAFVDHAADRGSDVLSLFDAVKEERNLETPFKAVGDCSRLIQG
jgi:pyruvate/oxaloacetate carboxyltransferase